MLPRTSLRHTLIPSVLVSALSLIAISPASENDGEPDGNNRHTDSGSRKNIELGPRPFFLVNDMEPGELKSKLKSCDNGPFNKTYFSIGHRGAALQFPEHTKESYQAAARMGAG